VTKNTLKIITVRSPSLQGNNIKKKNLYKKYSLLSLSFFTTSALTSFRRRHRHMLSLPSKFTLHRKKNQKFLYSREY
jgi:hypothetical protein